MRTSPPTRSGWQWTAGCGADAAPFFRIFNPVLQAERYDPARVYIRRWLPELAGLPDKWIHRPWEAPAEVLAQAGVTLGQTYPHPIVELPASRDAALAAYAPTALRGTASPLPAPESALAGFTYWPGGCATPTIRSQSNRRRSPP